MKPRSLLISTLTAIAATCCPLGAHAQEVCSVDEVSEALNGLYCYADGAYVSPESVAISVSNLCYDAYSPEDCSACFARARRKLYPTLKTLIKVGLVDRLTLRDYRDALVDAEDETCYADNGYPWEDANKPGGKGRNKGAGKGKH